MTGNAVELNRTVWTVGSFIVNIADKNRQFFMPKLLANRLVFAIMVPIVINGTLQQIADRPVDRFSIRGDCLQQPWRRSGCPATDRTSL